MSPSFIENSIRAALSSKAGSTILSLLDLPQKPTWQRFYKKLIIDGNEAYKKSVKPDIFNRFEHRMGVLLLSHSSWNHYHHRR